jgi:hypothetical protein
VNARRACRVRQTFAPLSAAKLNRWNTPTAVQGWKIRGVILTPGFQGTQTVLSEYKLAEFVSKAMDAAELSL